MPSGRTVVSCSTPLGVGGLGRHLQEAMDALARRGAAGVCVCDPLDAEWRPVTAGVRRLAARSPRLTRRSPAWSAWAASVAFDLDAARRLPAAEHLIAFNGSALLQLRAAGRARMQSLSLMSANSHLRRVVRMYALAHRQYPLERPWATRLLGRNLAEYALADRIYVSSGHAWESFVEEGVPEERLVALPADARPPLRTRRGRTRVRVELRHRVHRQLSVAKGVPLLIDAVRRLPHPDLRLVLGGRLGYAGDAALRAAGLRRGRRASSCVRGTLAPSAARGAVRAPELRRRVRLRARRGARLRRSCDRQRQHRHARADRAGRNGLVVPTGDLDALSQAIDAAYRGEVFGEQ